MREYERNLKNPVRNMLVGDLIRVILIQVQKLKVDLAIAMKALDKLMKSNQLNFEMFAVIPTILLVSFIFKMTKDRFEKRQGRLSASVEFSLQSSLREVEKRLIQFINYTEPDAQTLGEIYIELHYFTIKILQSLKNQDQLRLILEDVESLKSIYLSPKQKHLILLRMIRSFKFLNPLK